VEPSRLAKTVTMNNSALKMASETEVYIGAVQAHVGLDLAPAPNTIHKRADLFYLVSIDGAILR
jgi:hypothetical protein